MRTFKSTFQALLREQDEFEDKSNSRPDRRFDKEEDSQNFEDSLDDDTNPAFIDTEGLPPEALEQFENVKQEIKSFGSELKGFAERLTNLDGNSILSQVIDFENNNRDDLSGVSAKISGPIKKAAESLEKVKVEFATLFAMLGLNKEEEVEQKGVQF